MSSNLQHRKHQEKVTKVIKTMRHGAVINNLSSFFNHVFNEPKSLVILQVIQNRCIINNLVVN